MTLETQPREGAPTEPVILDLTSVDGNAFSIMAAVAKALRKAGASTQYIDAIRTEMITSDYDHLLQVAIREIDGSGDED